MKVMVFVLLLLLPLCLAKPFHQKGLFDFMLEDEPGSGGDAFPDLPAGPMCPFRCQCYLRVVQCSDLGKLAKRLLPLVLVYSDKLRVQP